VQGSAAEALLLLTGTTSYRIEDFLAAAASVGVEVLLGSNQCRTLAELWRVEALVLDFEKPEEAAAAVVAAARRRPIAGIVPVGEPQAVVAALAARALGIPFNPPEAARAARDKRRMRETLAAAGVPQPEFHAFPLEVAATEVLAYCSLPCVVKPSLLSGSRGVMRADTATELAAALDRLRALLTAPELFQIDSRELLVESFVPGAEVALEGLVVDGRLEVLAIFDKPDPLDGPFFEETIYVTPSRHPAAVREAIVHTTARAVEALGAVGGPVHAELRLPPGGPVVIEVALRTVGGLCARALRFGAGTSLEELVIRHALGRSMPAPRREEGGAGVMMLPIPRAGTLKAVHGLDGARAVAGIEDVVIAIQPGRVLRPLPEGNEYLGFLFARAGTPADVERALRAAHAALSFEIAPLVARF
jgi:biotin carboxylase